MLLRRLWTTSSAAHSALQRGASARHDALLCAHVPLRAVAAVRPLSAFARAKPSEDDDDEWLSDAYARIVKKTRTLFGERYCVDALEDKIETSVKFLQSFGLSHRQAVGTIARHPMIIRYSNDTIERKVSWFKLNGVSNDNIVRMLTRHPSVVGMSERSLEATKQWFLNQGIDEDKVPFYFTAFPQSMSMSLDTLDRKTATIMSFGLTRVHMRRIYRRAPQILTMSVESMIQKVRVLKTLGLPEDQVAKVIAVVPEILALSTDRVKEKLAMLNECYGDGRAVELWLSSPRIVMNNTEQLRRSFEFLTKEVGYTTEQLGQNVNHITRSVDRILRPRYQFFVENGLQEELERIKWIAVSDARFIDEYPSYAEFLDEYTRKMKTEGAVKTVKPVES
ncbi:hypothetical protein PINS_up002643 [Pythium insidiosum]|nr:hypothetical protein PINS_up002643 [Pythium insidiosum]